MNWYLKSIEITNKLENSKTFWWILGAINSTCFAVNVVAGRWLHVIFLTGMVGWCMYELYRIQKLEEVKNDKPSE